MICIRCYLMCCGPQVEMTGSSVFDYVHVKDHPELAEHLGLAIPQGINKDRERIVYL